MGSWETDWSRDVLERIIILLFALANLADRAAGAAWLCRRRVLGILSGGEVEARAFVIGVATGSPAPEDVPEFADDAECLAVRLRSLALALCVLLLARRFAHPGAVGRRACRPSRRISGPAVRRLDTPPPPAPDTS